MASLSPNFLFPWLQAILLCVCVLDPRQPSPEKETSGFFFFFFHFSFIIYMCIQGLVHFSPLPPSGFFKTCQLGGPWICAPPPALEVGG
jgi:hypothetical protein